MSGSVKRKKKKKAKIFIFLRRKPVVEDGWFPFVIAKNLHSRSPANVGKVILDAPAGKHGFLEVKDGHFYFKDGTRARFWGTNLCFSGNFPDKRQAVMIAKRLAFFGFNAVRLHHLDGYFEPRGIFKDTCPSCGNPQEKKTGVLSEKQLKKLDYLIYQLKSRGIYVDINLLVSRRFTLADGVKAAGKLKSAAKPVSIFDPILIDLQKQYAKDLLTHYNPYTKLRYVDDPAVALVEITNENSIFKLNRKLIPDYYLGLLDAMWSNFDKDGYFSQDEAKKAFLVSLEKKYVGQMKDFLIKECDVKVPITGIAGYARKDVLTVFEEYDFVDIHAYWDHPFFFNRHWDYNDFRIDNNSMLLSKGLGLAGKIEGRIPRIDKPQTVTEWNQAYPNQYAYEAPLIMARSAVEKNLDGVFQFAFSHKGSSYADVNDMRYYFDIVANPQQLILNSIGSLIFHSMGKCKTFPTTRKLFPAITQAAGN